MLSDEISLPTLEKLLWASSYNTHILSFNFSFFHMRKVCAAYSLMMQNEQAHTRQSCMQWETIYSMLKRNIKIRDKQYNKNNFQNIIIIIINENLIHLPQKMSYTKNIINWWCHGFTVDYLTQDAVNSCSLIVKRM